MPGQASYSLYQPLVFIGLAALIVFLIAKVLGARDSERGERALDISFGLTLLAGVYVVILLLIAIGSQPNAIYDMVVVVLVVTAFFAVLVSLLFLVFELFGGLFGRRRSPVEAEAEGEH